MKSIIGEYFASGFVHGKDLNKIILDDVNLLENEKSWVRIDNKINAYGIYPDNIPLSEKYAGQKFSLELYKLIYQNKEIIFGCVEVQICWYLFYKFNDNAVLLINKSEKRFA